MSRSYRLTAVLVLVIGIWIRPVIAVTADTVAVMNPMRVDVSKNLSRIRLPPGFHIDIYARDVAGARTMSLSPAGTLYLGTFAEWGKKPYGKVYAVQDLDRDHRADKIWTIADGLNYPNGVAFHDGDLYIAEISRISRLRDIEKRLHSPPRPEIVSAAYPQDFHHGWKFIRFGPDGRLYVPVGAPCNTCEPALPHGSITRLRSDGGHPDIFARGIRNSVGFDWHPVTGELWFADNGRDGWGNDQPAEELNHAPRAGLHFGYPYRYGKTLVDPSFSTTMNADEFQPAAMELPAHTAPLGIRFYTGAMFPADYRNQLFIAQHGSWNRDPPDGYRVTLVRFRDNRPQSHEIFADGWLQGKHFWGRPVDVEIMPDGSLLVSDDFNGVIYRIWYDGSRQRLPGEETR